MEPGKPLSVPEWSSRRLHLGGRNQIHEPGDRPGENVQQLRQTPISISGLLSQLHYDDSGLLTIEGAEKTVRVEGEDSPRLKVLFREVPEIEGNDDGGPQETAAARTCRSFSSFVIRETSEPWPVTHASPKCERSPL